MNDWYMWAFFLILNGNFPPGSPILKIQKWFFDSLRDPFQFVSRMLDLAEVLEIDRDIFEMELLSVKAAQASYS